ncbi:MAG: hypothetical protein ACREBS_01470, partial [Nitrososphaerales archaeon]
ATFINSSKKTMAIPIAFILGLALHFAAFQFAMFTSLGFCLLGLSIYRMANAFLRFVAFGFLK